MALPLIVGALALGAKVLPLLANLGKPVFSAFKSAGSFLTGPISRGGMLTMTAAPTIATIAVGVAEHESGGALSQAAINATTATIRAGLESGAISYETVESAMDATEYIAQISNVVDKAAQNQAVMAAIGRGENPAQSDIREGKTVAAAWQLSHAPSLTAKTLVRMGIADKLYENRDDADRYVAEKFTDDIIKGAQVSALKGHPVGKEDVRAALEKMAQSGVGNALIAGRLRYGLQLMWPGIFPSKKPDTSAAVTPSENAFQSPAAEVQPDVPFPAINLNEVKGRKLRTLFDQVTQTGEEAGSGLGWKFNILAKIVKGVTGFLETFNVFGWADDIIDSMKRHVLEMAQDDVINQGENWFGASDSRPHNRSRNFAPKPEFIAP